MGECNYAFWSWTEEKLIIYCWIYTYIGNIYYYWIYADVSIYTYESLFLYSTVVFYFLPYNNLLLVIFPFHVSILSITNETVFHIYDSDSCRPLINPFWGHIWRVDNGIRYELPLKQQTMRFLSDVIRLKDCISRRIGDHNTQSSTFSMILPNTKRCAVLQLDATEQCIRKTILRN